LAHLSRRSFLERGATLVAAGWAVPSFIAETARLLDAGPSVTAVPTAHAAGRRVLVILQLAGGNDGLNTLVPYGDPAYYAPNIRPTLAVPQNQVLPLNGSVGLHPNLSRMKKRWDQGQIAIIQGVSYPNPNRSHFRGTDIWETARPDTLEPSGWIGRYYQQCGCTRSDQLQGMTVGKSAVPRTFWTEMALVPAVASLASFRYLGATLYDPNDNPQRQSEIQTLKNALAQSSGHPEGEYLRQSMSIALQDADVLASAAGGYTPIGAYPTDHYGVAFGNSMKLTAQLIAADVGTSIYYVSLPGFDTHAGQSLDHTRLLDILDRSLDGFFQDMDHIGKTSDVTVLTFSEFGRRLAQNGSDGTDHGVAAPMFAIGGGLNGGLYGSYPSLTDLTDGDLKMTVDFRQVYASVLQNWLGISSSGILGGSFNTLPLFNGTPTQPTPPGPACSPRPPVHMTATPGGGQLQVTVTAGGGTIKQIRFGPTQNAIVSVNGQSGQTGSFTYAPASATAQASFIVRRAAGGPATVPIVVVDDCGEWPTFVGGGASAF
jgi:uncharacterized protein (DUF1501 family)